MKPPKTRQGRLRLLIARVKSLRAALLDEAFDSKTAKRFGETSHLTAIADKLADQADDLKGILEDSMRFPERPQAVPEPQGADHMGVAPKLACPACGGDHTTGCPSLDRLFDGASR